MREGRRYMSDGNELTEARDEPVIGRNGDFVGVALPENVSPRALVPPERAIRLGEQLVYLGELLRDFADVEAEKADAQARLARAAGLAPDVPTVVRDVLALANDLGALNVAAMSVPDVLAKLAERQGGEGNAR